MNAIALNGTTVAIASEKNGGGLPQPSFNQSPFQAAPAGGLDRFLMIGSIIPTLPIELYSTSYLGGSGDDTVLGVVTNSSAYYVTV